MSETRSYLPPEASNFQSPQKTSETQTPPPPANEKKPSLSGWRGVAAAGVALFSSLLSHEAAAAPSPQEIADKFSHPTATIEQTIPTPTKPDSTRIGAPPKKDRSFQVIDPETPAPQDPETQSSETQETEPTNEELRSQGDYSKAVRNTISFIKRDQPIDNISDPLSREFAQFYVNQEHIDIDTSTFRKFHGKLVEKKSNFYTTFDKEYSVEDLRQIYDALRLRNNNYLRKFGLRKEFYNQDTKQKVDSLPILQKSVAERSPGIKQILPPKGVEKYQNNQKVELAIKIEYAIQTGNPKIIKGQANIAAQLSIEFADEEITVTAPPEEILAGLSYLNFYLDNDRIIARERLDGDRIEYRRGQGTYYSANENFPSKNNGRSTSDFSQNTYEDKLPAKDKLVQKIETHLAKF